MVMILIAIVNFLLIIKVNSQLQDTIQTIFNTIRYVSDDPTEGLVSDTARFRNEYDFIVIGSGSGGSVVANRLTENPSWNVLVVEAGRDEMFLTEVPLTASILEVTSYNWGFKAQKQKKACLKLIDKVCNWPSGKAVGGTSVINDLLYNRGNKYDYDEWKSFGNEGWGYDDVLPYFIKSERAEGLDPIDKEYHGTDGFLNVETAPYRSLLVDLFLSAGQELGYPSVDINGRTPLGFSLSQSTMRKGRRCSASKAFLRPIRNRPNFHLTKESLVTQILINSTTKQAYGVEFQKNGKLYRIAATKEVILAAGATSSPQLLMLSGIGPSKDLERLNISVVQNLSVGFNLQDHISFQGLAFLVNESLTLTGRKVLNVQAVYDFIVNNKGPYTVPGGAEAFAFVQTNNSKIKDAFYSNLEIILAASAINSDTTGSIRNTYRLPTKFYNSVYRGIKEREAFSTVPILLKPKSRGRITLRSANVKDSPLIYPNFFDEQDDLDTIVEGIKMAIAVGESKSFQRYQSRLNTRPYPGCEHHSFRSDAYWRCCAQNYAATLFHPVGTCKMGPDSDPDAVVDPQLRVKGVKGLRVVDASIMPTIVAGHTNGPVFMIGEKGADFIKDAWQNEL